MVNLRRKDINNESDSDIEFIVNTTRRWLLIPPMRTKTASITKITTDDFVNYDDCDEKKGISMNKNFDVFNHDSVFRLALAFFDRIQ